MHCTSVTSVLLNDVFMGAMVNDNAASTVFVTRFVVVRHANGAHSARRGWTFNVFRLAALPSRAGYGETG